MQIIQKINQLRRSIAQLKSGGKTIGFVPTMGAFHPGHLSLFRRSKESNDVTLVSIFVNPLQFGPKEDFHKYPRDFKKDISLAKKENVDIIFHPSVFEMYPSRFLTLVHVRDLTSRMCGESRPGHFDGVATVVTKLLNIVEPDVMYLGQKDAQQCVVLKQVVNDLDIPVKIAVVPTLRESDGLAMSSRNVYLTPKQRKEAVFLNRALEAAKIRILKGERRTSRIIQDIKKMILNNTSGKIDYIECVNAQDLDPVKQFKGNILIAIAVRIGKTRLIDNIVIKLPN